MTKAEIAELLAMVAAIESRKIGQADIESWHAFAAADRWPSLPVAKRAVVKHHSARPDDRLRPGHVSGIVREVRDFAGRVFAQPSPPTEMRDPDEREAWINHQYRTWIDEYFAAWAAGDDSPGPKLRQRRFRAIEGGGAA